MFIKSKSNIMNLLLLISSLLITFCILTSCNNVDLDNNKKIQKEELQKFLNSKQQNSYTAEDWREICEIIKSGQESVDLATNIQDIKYSVCESKINVEAISPNEVNPIINGAFFITELSWERYVRKFAKEYNQSEKWINSVLEGGDGGELRNSLLNKNLLWVAVLNGQMTVSKRAQTVFSISSNDGIGVDNVLNSNVRFWLVNNILTIIESDDVWQFIYDSDYNIAEQSEVKLNSPQNIEISIDEFGSKISLFWEYLYSYGNAGAVVEVKGIDEQEFTIIKIEYPYKNLYVVELEESIFKSEKNVIKVYHKGGPMLNASDKLVYQYVNSEPMFFEAIIENNSIQIIKFN